MARPIYGGWVSLTAHLALKENAQVWKLSGRTEKKDRPFGYGVTYRNTSVWPTGNTIVVALDKHYYSRLNMIPDGTYVAIHDPTEITPTLKQNVHRFRVIVTRKSMLNFFPNATYLPHPLYAFPLKQPKEVRAPVSISRIDWDKNIDVILAANGLGADVTLWGAHNRLYIHHAGLGDDMIKYHRGVFPKSFEAVADILAGASCVVDMSAIKHDGGGVQYTFLEAIYAGLPLILNKKWVEYPDSIWNERNCVAVSTPQELADATRRADLPIAMEILVPHLNARWGETLFP